jgi:hypothetical protein
LRWCSTSLLLERFLCGAILMMFTLLPACLAQQTDKSRVSVSDQRGGNTFDPLTIVGGGLIGFLSAILAEPVRRWAFRPKLKLTFVEKGDHFVTMTSETSGAGTTNQAYFVRVHVVNTSWPSAKCCQAYLARLERRNASGKGWDDTTYCESIPLPWSGRKDDRYKALDLPRDVPHVIDIVSTRDNSTSFRLETLMMLKRHVPLLSAHETYRFTIVVSGDGVTPTLIRIRFRWTGQWDAFEAQEDNG